MTLKVSTGLRNHVLDTGSVRSALNGGFIKYYSGAVPGSADDALGASVLIVTISLDATGVGINFDTLAATGILAKAPLEIWRGICAVSGTPTFYRHVASTDTGVLSTTEKRLQGAIATVGAEINLSSTALVSGASETLDFYVVNFPTL